MRRTLISFLRSARNSLGLMALDLSFPSYPRLALIAVRRKFEMPLRISRPSTVTRKSLISKSAIDPPNSTRALSMRIRLNPSFVLNLGGTAVQGDPQGVYRQRRALHPSRADLDPQLFQQVAGREVFQFADRPACEIGRAHV